MSKVFVSVGTAYAQKFIENNGVKENVEDFRSQIAKPLDTVAKYISETMVTTSPNGFPFSATHLSGQFAGNSTSADAVIKLVFSDICIKCGANKSVLEASGTFKDDYHCPICGAEGFPE